MIMGNQHIGGTAFTRLRTILIGQSICQCDAPFGMCRSGMCSQAFTAIHAFAGTETAFVIQWQLYVDHSILVRTFI